MKEICPMVFNKIYRPVWKKVFQAKQVYNSVSLNERHISKKYRIEISRTEPAKICTLEGYKQMDFPASDCELQCPGYFDSHTQVEI